MMGGEVVTVLWRKTDRAMFQGSYPALTGKRAKLLRCWAWSSTDVHAVHDLPEAKSTIGSDGSP